MKKNSEGDGCQQFVDICTNFGEICLEGGYSVSVWEIFTDYFTFLSFLKSWIYDQMVVKYLKFFLP